MKKLLFKIISISLVLLALLTLNWWKTKQEEKEEAKKDEEAKLFTLAWEKIDKVSIQGSKGSVVLERRKKNDKGGYEDAFAFLDAEAEIPSDWIVVAPYQDLADRSAITGLIDAISELKSKKTISEDGARASEYSLHQPSLKVELFEAGKDAPAWSLRVGDENTAKESFYAQTSAQPKIYLIDKNIELNVSREPRDWRSKTVIGFKDVKNIERLRLKKGAAEFLFVRSGDGWSMEKPKRLPASKVNVNAIIRDLGALTMKSLVSENRKKDAAKFGLASPAGSVTVTLKTGDTETQKTILIGKEDEKAGSLYVAREDRDRIYEVNPTLKGNAFKTFEQFVSKDAFELREDQLEGVHFQYQAETVDLVKKDGKWVRASEKDQKEPKALDGVYRIVNLDALDFLGTTYAKLPKDPSALRVMTLELKGKESSETLTLYKDAASEDHLIGHVKKYGLYYRFLKKDVEPIENSIREFLGMKVEKTPPPSDIAPNDDMLGAEGEHIHD